MECFPLECVKAHGFINLGSIDLWSPEWQIEVMSKEMIVRVCQSCLVGAGLIAKTENSNQSSQKEQLAQSLLQELNFKDSSKSWKVEITGCLDVCPDSQVGLAFQAIDSSAEELKTHTQNPTLSGIVSECIQKAAQFN